MKGHEVRWQAALIVWATASLCAAPRVLWAASHDAAPAFESTSSPPGPLGTSDTTVATAAGDADEPHHEWGVLPALGYDPDKGLQIGVFTHVASIDPEVRPYWWRLRAQVQTSILDRDGLEFPQQEHFFRIDLPRVPDQKSRLRLDFTWERQINVGYFGIGNDTRAGDPDLDGDAYHEFLVRNVSAKASLARFLWAPSWQGILGASVAAVLVEPYAGSLLQQHLDAGVPTFGVGEYPEASFIAGLLLDTRDHETFPTRGLYHDVVVLASPSLGESAKWFGVTYTARFYVPLYAHDVVWATRLLGDVLFGDAPLGPLAEYGGVQGAPAFGGPDGVRGIAGGRFRGKTKVLGSAELRAQLLPFRLFGENMNLGAVIFADAGRVWARSFAPDPLVDGNGLGLHWGVGGGPRLRWGDSLLIRLEFAHSPNTSDFGGDSYSMYLTADSKF